MLELGIVRGRDDIPKHVQMLDLTIQDSNGEKLG